MKGKIPALLFSLVLGATALIVSVPQTRMFLLLLALIPLLAILFSALIPRWIILDRNESEIFSRRFQSFSVEFSVKNRSPFPIPPFLVSDRTENIYTRNAPVFRISLRPFETRVLSYQAEGNERGLFRCGPLVCSGKDPFRLFSWSKVCEKRTPALIYPATLSTFVHYRNGTPVGTIKSRSPLYEDNTRFESVRPYREGDNPRKINWKATARTNRIMITEFESSLSLPITLLLNFDERDYLTRFRSDMLEKGVEAAASLAHHFTAKRETVRFFTNGVLPETPEKPTLLITPSGFGSDKSIMRALASLKPVSQGTRFGDFIEGLPVLQHKSRLFIISPPLDPSQNNSLIRYGGKSGGCLILLMDFDSSPDKKTLLSIPGWTHITLMSRGKEPLHEA